MSIRHCVARSFRVSLFAVISLITAAKAVVSPAFFLSPFPPFQSNVYIYVYALLRCLAYLLVRIIHN
jgi:hypothetical protein